MWLIRGLKKGIITTQFPKKDDETIPKSYYPDNLKNCTVFTDIHDFSCMGCGICKSDMVRREDHVEVRKTLPIKKSVHIFVLDVGSCGACNREISLLGAPQYDFHRLGFFTTPTPKHADVLMVVGELTEDMLPILRESYELMPGPKAVLAVGACASGISFKKIEKVVPVFARVSGCPPQPKYILKALLQLTGRWNE